MPVAITVEVIVVLVAVAEEVVHSVIWIPEVAVLIRPLILEASIIPVVELVYWGAELRKYLRKSELLAVATLMLVLMIVSELVLPLMLELFIPALA